MLPTLLKNTTPNYSISQPKSEFNPFTGLHSNGSISRGISVGNNQDAVLASSLNLQLNGDLGNGTEIRASITDNSLPVQAEGYTQQLQEFDKVYLEIENKDFGLLRAGDYNLHNRSHHFLGFDKRITGAGIFSKFSNENHQVPLQLQGGVARGKFARNSFMGQEGNQGPYKLKGNTNEAFIIIISGSERVYIDGILQKRGEQNQYVIDYNAAEISFTALQPISREKRIVVEFQYTELNYLRTLAFAETGFKTEKWNTTIQYYSEQDSKNQTVLNDLSNPEKELLQGVGDDLEAAQISTIQAAAFSNSRVQYHLIDSLGIDSVLVYSTDSSQQLYEASFSYLGAGNGDYILQNNSANGRVFKWLPPQGGQAQGSYAPVKQLGAPSKHQIISLQSEASLGKHKVKANLASSNFDRNRFSDKNASDNTGYAAKVDYGWEQKLKKGKAYSSLNYEYNQANFKAVERLQQVEFLRDWSLSKILNGDLHLAKAQVGVNYKKWESQYQLQSLQSGGYQGWNQQLKLQLKTAKTTGLLRGSYLTANDSLLQTQFIRQSARLQHFVAPKLWVGGQTMGEWNKRESLPSDSLLGSSFQFIQYQGFTGYGDTANNFIELNYLQRWDDSARAGNYNRSAAAQALGLKSQWKNKFKGRLQAQLQWRELRLYEGNNSGQGKTITSRLNYNQRFFKNSLSTLTFYESGSGTEAKRLFSYLEVPAGTGRYTWTDYNENGIAELDEFEIAPTPDLATYVRIFTQTNDYLRTDIQKFGETLNLQAPSSWKKGKDWKALVHRFSLLANYQIDRKTLLEGNQNELNPFKKVAHDSLIVSLNNSFRTSVFFNRSAAKFGLTYTYRLSDNRNLLSFGIEQRNLIENGIKIKYQPFDKLRLESQSLIAQKENVSANFSSRNYGINQVKQGVTTTFLSNQIWQVSLIYLYDLQESKGENLTKIEANRLALNANHNAAKKLNFTGELAYIYNNFKGNSNSPAAYEMLQELKPGKNFSWNAGLQRRLKKNIMLSIIYNGRNSENAKAIHTGSMEIKAFF